MTSLKYFSTIRIQFCHIKGLLFCSLFLSFILDSKLDFGQCFHKLCKKKHSLRLRKYIANFLLFIGIKTGDGVKKKKKERSFFSKKEKQKTPVFTKLIFSLKKMGRNKGRKAE